MKLGLPVTFKAAPLGQQQIGHYRVLRVLGEGGMGVVYLAERQDLGNLVAIKVMREAWLSNARRRRFEAEQRTLARLNHPSIARLYDAGELADGTPWFVMQEAIEARPRSTPSWAGFPVLVAFMDHRPAKEIGELARATEPVPDPEMNYFSADHLAYAGDSRTALRLLREAVTGGYCSYPAIDSDPMLASIRSSADFAEVRSLAKECRARFAAAANPAVH